MRTVLAIGLRDDPHIAAVGLAIRDLGVNYFLFDPSEGEGVPLLSQAEEALGVLTRPDGHSLDLSSVDTVFCRYAIDGIRPSAELPDIQKYGVAEQLQSFLAPLRSIGTERWINDPWMEARSDCKILQRNLAGSLGMRTPSQVISNDLTVIETFFGSCECVVKPLSDTSLGITSNDAYCDRPIPTSQFLAPYTAKFEAALAREHHSDGTPLLVQEKIDKKADLRCMVIDEEVHCFAIPYAEGEAIDFRITPCKEIAPFELSSITKERLIELNRHLHIRYSACDLLLSQSGEEVFLEANVSGNWLFCDVVTDMPVTRSIARKLVAA